MDSPNHLTNIEGYKKLYQILPKRLIGNGLVIDTDAQLLVSYLVMWEKEHGQIKHSSALCCLYSGWDKYWDNKIAYLAML